MNKSYSLKRLSLLFKKQWMEYGRIYLITAAILFGVLSLIYVFEIITVSSFNRQNLSGNEWQFLSFSEMRFRESIVMVSLCVYMSVMAGHYFSRYAHPAGGIQELTLPVSYGERLFIGVLTGVILCGLTYWIIFFAVDSLVISFLRVMYSWVDIEGLKRRYQDWHEAGFLSAYQAIDSRSWTIFVYTSLLLPSLFLLGSLYFNRFAFLKSTLVVVFFFMLNVAISSYLGRALHEGMVNIVDYGNPSFEIKWIYLVSLPLILFGVWIAIFYRLKEKEV